MIFERTCVFFQKLLKVAIFALQCDWKSEKSQNFSVFGALKKNRWTFFREKFFFEKNIIFSKNAKGSQFAVECDWISKISQRVQNIGFC